MEKRFEKFEYFEMSRVTWVVMGDTVAPFFLSLKRT